MSPKKAAASEPGFDERLQSLETLVTELEDGGLGLEAAIARYQEGIALLRACHETLGAYKARIEELSREAGATVTAIADPDFQDPEETP